MVNPLATCDLELRMQPYRTMLFIVLDGEK